MKSVILPYMPMAWPQWPHDTTSVDTEQWVRQGIWISATVFVAYVFSLTVYRRREPFEI